MQVQIAIIKIRKAIKEALRKGSGTTEACARYLPLVIRRHQRRQPGPWTRRMPARVSGGEPRAARTVDSSSTPFGTMVDPSSVVTTVLTLPVPLTWPRICPSLIVWPG